MLIQRLQWAGVLLECGRSRILIDPVFKSPNPLFFGEPHQEFSALEDIKDIDVILLSHLHSDHFDPDLIHERFGSEVQLFVPRGNESVVREKGFSQVKGIEVGEAFELGNVTIIGSHSVDGLGDNQLSWVVKYEEKSVIHCGDTLWHGYWWHMAKEYGPFDVAFLPVNGAVVREEGMINSNQPICLNPEQAISAAKVLQSKWLIPIHYGAFHNPPIYLETEDVEGRLLVAAEKEKVDIKLLNHREEIII